MFAYQRFPPRTVHVLVRTRRFPLVRGGAALSSHSSKLPLSALTATFYHPLTTLVAKSTTLIDSIIVVLRVLRLLRLLSVLQQSEDLMVIVAGLVGGVQVRANQASPSPSPSPPPPPTHTLILAPTQPYPRRSRIS